MPSPPNFSDRLPTFNASRTLMDSFKASPLSLNSKRKRNRVATKIQALFRGRNTRRKVKASKQKKQSRMRRALSKLSTLDAPMLDIGRLLSSSGRTLRSNRKY